MDDAAIYSLMRPRKVCVCRQVSQEEIERAVDPGGARDFAAVQSMTNCSTGCGTCEGAVRQIIKSSLAKIAPTGS